MTAITPGRDAILSLLDLVESAISQIEMTTRRREIFAYALRLAAKPADEGVRELKQRIHNLRVTLSSVVTLAESAPVNLKTHNAIAKAARQSLDRDALSPSGEPKP